MPALPAYNFIRLYPPVKVKKLFPDKFDRCETAIEKEHPKGSNLKINFHYDLSLSPLSEIYGFGSAAFTHPSDHFL